MPRHSRLRRVLKIVGGASVGALLLFAGGRTTYAPGPLFSGGLAANNWPPPPPPILPPAFLFPPPECSETDTDLALPRRLLPVRGRGAAHSHPLDAVLLPDSEVLVLAASEPAGDPGNLTCAFEGGASSPARSLGRLPGPGRHAYLCAMPQPAPAPLRAPLLLPSSAAPVPAADFPGRPLLNWGDRLVFDSALLDGGDVLVFAKGVPHLQGDVRCVYHGRADGLAASFPAITSAQQVVRFPIILLLKVVLFAGLVIFNCTQLGSIIYYFCISCHMMEEFICDMNASMKLVPGAVWWALVAAVANFGFLIPLSKELWSCAKRISPCIGFQATFSPARWRGDCRFFSFYLEPALYRYEVWQAEAMKLAKLREYEEKKEVALAEKLKKAANAKQLKFELTQKRKLLAQQKKEEAAQLKKLAAAEKKEAQLATKAKKAEEKKHMAAARQQQAAHKTAAKASTSQQNKVFMFDELRG